MLKKLKYFSIFEWALLLVSVTAILVFFFVFDGTGYMELICSLLGVVSLIFIAKGNPIGQVITIVFSVLYAIISYFVHYYGEMITYLGMTLPMAVVALITWLRHPYGKSRAQVSVGKMSGREYVFMFLLGIIVTVIFYFILQALSTSNLYVSTVSILTSFLACYLLFRRVEFYAVAYAANDIVLIVLWSIAVKDDISALSMLICFCVFFLNDMYAFFNWRIMKARQKSSPQASI